MRSRVALIAFISVAVLLAAIIACSKKTTAPPSCQLAVNVLDFGSVQAGHAVDRTFTVTNGGGGTLTGSITADCAGFSIIGSAAYSLGHGQTETFTVRFAPVAPGSYHCTIGTGCGEVQGSGVAIDPSVCSVSPTELDFGTVLLGESADRSFTITNTGEGTLTGTAQVPCPSLGFSIVGKASYSLTAKQSATIAVRLSPTAIGAVGCTVDLGNSGCGGVSCSGAGDACQLSTSALDFGSATYGTRATRTFTVSNHSSEAETFIFHGCDSFGVDPSSVTLQPDAAGVITVFYDSFACGDHACAVTVATNHGSCGQVSCTGSTPPEFDFGDVAIGQTVSREIVVQNPCAPGATNSIGSDTNYGDFSLSPPGFISNYLARFPMTYLVSFRPTKSGTQTATMQLLAACYPLSQYGVIRNICVTGSGHLEPGTPACSVSSRLLDFGSVAIGASADRTLTIRNDGGGVLAGTVQPSGCGEFVVQGDPTFGLTAGQSATFTIRFTPGQAGHAYSCYVFATGPDCPPVTLTGAGR